MGENINDNYYDSNNKLSNSSNKISENPTNDDILKRFMKIWDNIEKIINDWRISDLWWNKLEKVKFLTSKIELDVISILERVEINKWTKQELIKQKIELVSINFINKVDNILNLS